VTDDQELLSFTNRDEWRAWLKSHHDRAAEAWLVLNKKGAHTASLSFEEVQAEALCFGWTDVKSKNIDRSRYALRFTPRRAGSVWSMSNIRRVEALIAEGRMTEAGLTKVAEAQQNGQWDAAIRSEQTDLIPSDLEKTLHRRKGALAGYRSLPHSRKKQLLHSLFTAKNQATRARRTEAILQVVADESASRNG
jgi:uncharacterized protein YdeI (YjbR/CyaY-like superfamily)